MSYLFVSYIFTQFKVWEKVFGDQILFTGSLAVLKRLKILNYGRDYSTDKPKLSEFQQAILGRRGELYKIWNKFWISFGISFG